MRRYALRDDQWERIRDLLPGREGYVGVTAKDNRLFVEAVLYRYRAGIPWRDLPERFGAWKKVHTRFCRWAKTGVWERIFRHLAGEADNEYAVIDTRDNSVTYRVSSHNVDARSHGVTPNLEGDTLYVAHDTGNAVTAIDTETGAISAAALTPNGGTITRAEEVVPTRVGHLLWASSRGDGTVKRIDLDAQAITDSVFIGANGQSPAAVQPESVLLTPSERTLVASMRGTPAALAFVDTVKVALSGRVEIGGPGTFGDLAVITPDGRFVYATFDSAASGTGGVAVVDVRSQKLVDVWAYPNTGRPHGIWYSRKTLHRLDDEP